MNGALKFFGNALKAIFFSPFYLLCFAIGLVICLINYLVGIVHFFVSGCTYGSEKENKYEVELLRRKQEKGVQ